MTTAPNRPGELLYRGPNVMMGYAASREDLALGNVTGGVLSTGDMAYMDEDGFLFITGRTKRDAKLFGLRINLDEVESMLRIHGPVAVVSKGDADSIGQTLWQDVLDLIYTGHSDLAWKLANAAGPKAQQKPFPALSDFCSLLRQSPYWPDLQPTLKDTPPACSTPATPASK